MRPGGFTIPGANNSVTKIAINGYGGDQVGALLLSPFIKPGSTSSTPYNHYALLRSLEDIFRTDGYLGYAGDSSLPTIGNDTSVFQTSALQ